MTLRLEKFEIADKHVSLPTDVVCTYNSDHKLSQIAILDLQTNQILLLLMFSSFFFQKKSR